MGAPEIMFIGIGIAATVILGGGGATLWRFITRKKDEPKV